MVHGAPKPRPHAPPASPSNMVMLTIKARAVRAHIGFQLALRYLYWARVRGRYTGTRPNRTSFDRREYSRDAEIPSYPESVQEV